MRRGENRQKGGNREGEVRRCGTYFSSHSPNTLPLPSKSAPAQHSQQSNWKVVATAAEQEHYVRKVVSVWSLVTIGKIHWMGLGLNVGYLAQPTSPCTEWVVCAVNCVTCKVGMTQDYVIQSPQLIVLARTGTTSSCIDKFVAMNSFGMWSVQSHTMFYRSSSREPEFMSAPVPGLKR